MTMALACIIPPSSINQDNRVQLIPIEANAEQNFWYDSDD